MSTIPPVNSIKETLESIKFKVFLVARLSHSTWSAFSTENHLIKMNKAHLITSAKDVAYIMGRDLEQNPIDRSPKIDLQKMNSDEQLMIKLLSDNINGLHIDLICLQSQFNAFKTASVLLQLEFQGFVKSLPGKIYALSLSN